MIHTLLLIGIIAAIYMIRKKDLQDAKKNDLKNRLFGATITDYSRRDSLFRRTKSKPSRYRA